MQILRWLALFSIVAALAACGDDSSSQPVCGNAKIEAGEGCDDGNTIDGDGCDSSCVATGCGNGIKTAGEACDDGNTVSGDGCDTNCTVTACGNSVMTAGETCDDGNAVNGDGCDTNCTASACGNGVMSTGEACDDGNAINGDSCDSNCTLPRCGNGAVAPGEGCDDGNAVNGDGCDSNCTVTACGNGVMTMGEMCDDHNTVSGDGCDSNCTVTACGNGILTQGEMCDDHNTVSGDGCDANCRPTSCGNGIVTAGETCDDGNTVSGDGCESNCTITTSVYIKASNTDAGDHFGGSVALSADGSTLAVGSEVEDSLATGIGGAQGDNSAEDAGAVYVFVRSGATSIQQAYLKASNTDAADGFGFSLALSADGGTLVVGAPGESSAATGIGGNQASNTKDAAGAVYVFTRSGTTWSQQAYVKASNTDSLDLFGFSVALSTNGSTLVVGALGESSAATGINGNQADNSTASSGAAYVFTRTGTVWSQQAYLKASNTGTEDRFGSYVAVSGDGSTAAVGAIGESSASAGINGNQADDFSEFAGAVYVFVRAGVVWSQQAYVKSSNPGDLDQFGTSVALSGDGSTLAVSAIGESSAASGVGGVQTDDSAENAGAVYVFTRSGAVWSQQAYVKASNTDADDLFGASIGLSTDGSTLVVGATGESSASAANPNNNGADFAGAVYRFTRSGTTWSQQAYVKAPNIGAGDQFGSCVSVTGNGATTAVGAIGEDSGAAGVSGDQSDNNAMDAGAVYVSL